VSETIGVYPVLIWYACKGVLQRVEISFHSIESLRSVLSNPKAATTTSVKNCKSTTHKQFHDFRNLTV